MALKKIGQIEALAINPAALKAQLRTIKNQVCMFYEEVMCALPKYRFKICETCPRNKRSSSGQNLKQLFDHVKTMAILMLKDRQNYPK